MLSCIVRAPLSGSLSEGDPLVKDLWRHSLATGVLAELLANICSPGLKPVAFNAGLIHDCGKLALLAASVAEVEPLLLKARMERKAMTELEIENLGVTHGQAGKWLMTSWGLPQQLMEAVWLHHAPAEVINAAAESTELVRLVRLAEHLAHEIMADGISGMDPGDVQEILQALGLAGVDLEPVKKKLGVVYAERCCLFDLDQDATEFYFEALMRANSLLAKRERESRALFESLEVSQSGMEVLAQTGEYLLNAETEDKALEVISWCFQSRLGVTQGAAALLVDNGVTGYVWKPEREPASFDMPVDKDGKADVSAFPKEIGAALAGMVRRLNSNNGGEASWVDSWYRMPIKVRGRVRGEVLLKMDEKTAKALLDLMSRAMRMLVACLQHLASLRGMDYKAERLVAAATEIRQNDVKLLRAERLAAVGQMAAGVAHEINNPLAILSARVQLLQRTENDPKRKSDLEIVFEQIGRIQLIVANLLHFARLKEPGRRPVNMNEVVERVVSILQGGFNKQNVIVEKKLDPDLPEVLADAGQMEQVFMNLLLNAQQAMEATGGGLITIQSESNSGNVRVIVGDTGVGIPKDILGKIFEPFYTTKAEKKGTGLGLSTVLGIVERHDGLIRVDSAPGQGTTVTVTMKRLET